MLFVRGEIVVINSLKRTSCARWLLAVHSLVCVLTFVWVIVILFWPWLCSLLFSFLNKALLRSCSIELLHHLYPPHNISSIHLTTTTEMRRSGRIIDGMRSGWRTLRDSVGLFSSPTPEPTSQNDIPKTSWVRQSTSSPVSDVSAPASTNRGMGSFCALWVWRRRMDRLPRCPSLYIDLPIESMVWRCGWWDTRMAAQHLSWDLVRPSSGLRELLKRWRRLLDKVAARRTHKWKSRNTGEPQNLRVMLIQILHESKF